MSIRDRLPRLSFMSDPADHGSDPEPRSEASLAAYDEMLIAEAFEADVPADLLKAMCWYASGWRQYTPDGAVLSTPTGAGTSFGAMQLNDVWHPDAFPEARSDVSANIAYAARVIRWLFEQTGDWRRATIAFFGHDRRAEHAARRTWRYMQQRPWNDRAGIVADDASIDHADAG